jgi:asparagine synthase (glutamine-hydrolysing)
MVRAILRGRLPDAIALRQCKMPFSPTYLGMLADQAAAARERIPPQRAAGAGEWLDLDWLDRALTRVASQPSLAHTQPFTVQSTAIAAEFFRWWSERSAGRS